MKGIRSSKTGQLIRNIATVISLVWETNARSTALLAILMVVAGLVPAIQLWISKLLLDTLAVIIQGGVKEPDGGVSRLLVLAGVQAGLFFLSGLLATVQNTLRELLAEQVRIQIGVKVLEKTNGLELSFFED